MILYEVPGLCGLEIWHGISRGSSLYRLRENRREYFEALRDFLVRLHHGDAVTEDPEDTGALSKAAGFERAVLCGGEALDPMLEPVLCNEPPPFEIHIDAAGQFAARGGAFEIFTAMNWQLGVALDLGQMQLKMITARGDCSLPRDLSRLPFGADALEADAGRERVRALIAAGLTRGAALLGSPPDGVVLGLPVALDRDGVARPASYPGLFGPVDDMFSFEIPTVVLNDAVLAALGFQPKNDEKTLVVTLGFGIGAALWTAAGRIG